MSESRKDLELENQELRRQLRVLELQILNLQAEMLRIRNERDEAITEAIRLQDELYPPPDRRHFH